MKKFVRLFLAVILSFSIFGNVSIVAKEEVKQIEYVLIVDEDLDNPISLSIEKVEESKEGSIWQVDMPTKKEVQSWMKKKGLDYKQYNIRNEYFVCQNKEEYNFGESVSFLNDNEEVLSLYVYKDVMITYLDEDKVLGTESVEIGKEALGITDPIKEGSTFDGWYKDKKYTKKWETSKKIEKDTKVYAKWKEETYSISYQLNQGTGSTTPSLENPKKSYSSSEEFMLPTPKREGYTFDGWIGSNGSEPQKEVKVEKGNVGDLEYIAQWSANEVSYEVVCQTVSGKELGRQSLKGTFDQMIRVSPKEFENYGTPEAQEVYLNKTEGIVITFRYLLPGYGITYDFSGGLTTSPNTTRYNMESNDIILNNPEKDGYQFIGWSGTDLEGDKNTKVVIPKGSKGDREYVAHYSPNTYTLHFEGTNKKIEDIKVDYDQLIVLPGDQQDGKKIKVQFETYGAGSIDAMESNIILKGWEIEDQFYEPGQVVKNLTIKNNETIKVEAIYSDKGVLFTLPMPIKQGQSFEGWFSNPTLKDKVGDAGDQWMTNKNVTLYAKWDVEGYQVDGQGKTWAKGSDEILTFTIKGTQPDEDVYENFVSLYNNAKPLNSQAFITEKGSLVLKIQPDFLETLSAGKHTFTANFKDGQAIDLHFSIVKEKLKKSKKTDGEKTGVQGSILTYGIVGVIALVGISFFRKG